jgi:pSer/pThr/pTyr-binding forkhead associated (FHA) protein
MPKLVVGRRGATLGSWFIEDKRVTIGRAEGTDIRIEDQAVSKQHAAIEVMGADHMLLDLDSANGTFVNGVKVARHLLRHGDVVEILDFQLRYVDHKSVVVGEGDRTMVFRNSQLDLPAAAAPAPAIAARASAIALPIGLLEPVEEVGANGSLRLDRTLTPLGDREKDYAAVLRRPSGFAIARVNGRAPRVDGKSISEGWQHLRDGAIIEIGGEKYALCITDMTRSA